MLASDSAYVSGTFWVSIALAVIAVAAIVVSVVIWRRGNPKRLIVWDMPIATSLLSGQATPSLARRLMVMFDGEPVLDPFLVELLVESRSRRDISVRNDFESPPEPLVFTIDAPFCQLLKVVDRGQLEAMKIWPNGVEIGPCTIRKGVVIRAQFVTTGRPEITHNKPLLDIDIRGHSDYKPPHFPVSVWLLAAMISALAGATFLHWIGPKVVTVAALTLIAIGPVPAVAFLKWMRTWDNANSQ